MKTCCHCGKEQPEITGTGQPKPGDPVVCSNCCATQTVDEAGNLVGMTQEQMCAFMNKPEQVAAVARMFQEIRIAKIQRHYRN